MTKGNGALRHQAEKSRTPSRIAVRHAARLGYTPKDLALPILKFLRAMLSGDPSIVRHHQSVALRAPGRATVAIIGPQPRIRVMHPGRAVRYHPGSPGWSARPSRVPP